MADELPGVLPEETPFNPQRPGWQARSACHPQVIPHVWQEFEDCRVPADLFFPVGLPSKQRREAIKSVCGACPVRSECLQHGMEHEEYGWWGGLPAGEVERERRERGITRKTPEVDPRTNLVIGTFIEQGHGTEARFTQHRRDGEEPCERCKEGRTAALHDKKAGAYREWLSTATQEDIDTRNAARRVRRAKDRLEGKLRCRG